MARVGVLGSLRIPFCRANTAYAELSNLDMLSSAIGALVGRYGLQGERIDEVIAGAVTTHSRDWNLAREAVLSTSLHPSTPAVTLQQACGTSLQAAFILGAKIAAGHVDVGVAAGVDTASDVPIVLSDRLSHRLLHLAGARSLRDRATAFRGFSPKELLPVPPSPTEPRTGLSMGQHCELMAREWQISRAEQDAFAVASHRKALAALDDGFLDDLLVPCEGATRDNVPRRDTSEASLATLKPAFGGGPDATLTAGNSTPLTDGAAAVLIASEEWAQQRSLPVQAWLTASRTAAVDFVGGEGLLMAPALAVSELLSRTDSTLQDFDVYEIHEAFAAQVLCTLKVWESSGYCIERLGRNEALGAIDPEKINTRGGSLAYGHPFAATGARLIGTLAKTLQTTEAKRGLISVCTAGGMGLAAVLESDAG